MQNIEFQKVANSSYAQASVNPISRQGLFVVGNEVGHALRFFTFWIYNMGKQILLWAHLRIALWGGNPEVGNSEYINHQNCHPNLHSIFV